MSINLDRFGPFWPILDRFGPLFSFSKTVQNGSERFISDQGWLQRGACGRNGHGPIPKSQSAGVTLRLGQARVSGLVSLFENMSVIFFMCGSAGSGPLLPGERWRSCGGRCFTHQPLIYVPGEKAEFAVGREDLSKIDCNRLV